ncbi:hypothetical protein FGE12_17635 [Aggregicoccus sp. 17bor-14]|uniref:TolB family protein n=1 Tax=Myxococcaceae TaxID=31 RepID=UPI00129D1668|nr:MULTISPECIES: MYXO-CTERM sorting domain-containing protein [Myxococcaceae]MBF5044224.1 PD40 domain-containing protein [Simulacricoccus sp. 17bor-14]MRI89974.1 hypothetical protein [Aggregicoccus sp. 17bor-14]
MRASKPWPLAYLLALAPALASAQVSPAPYPAGTPVVVNAGPGDQKEPHVSGDTVAYSSELNGVGEIRVFDLSTHVDAAIPNGGAFDFLSDVSGDSVVFTRIGADRSAILRYDVAAGGAPVELAPAAGTNRRAASVGGRTVAWEDYGAWGSQGVAPELVVYDLDSGVTQALTSDALSDTAPAVSPDGRTVVWTKCEGAQGPCNVWEAQAGASGFVAHALTSDSHGSANPDTNGTVVVYDSARPGADGTVDQDIFLQDVGDSAERRLVLPGQDLNPSVSGHFIAFQRRFPDAAVPNSDIALYDLDTSTLYRLTDTPEDEQLTDIWISPDGKRVNVVWSVRENGDDNVRALTFQATANECTPPAPQTAAQVCAAPGKHPLLAELQLQRERRTPWDATARYSATGTGVLCVDNGFGGARALGGLVAMNDRVLVMLETCSPDQKTVALEQQLASDGFVYAAIAGDYGSAFRVRLYGELPACIPSPAAPLPAQGQRISFVDAGSVVVIVVDTGHGCSSTGQGTALAGLGLLALAALRRRRAPAQG